MCLYHLSTFIFHPSLFRSRFHSCSRHIAYTLIPLASINRVIFPALAATTSINLMREMMRRTDSSRNTLDLQEINDVRF